MTEAPSVTWTSRVKTLGQVGREVEADPELHRQVVRDAHADRIGARYLVGEERRNRSVRLDARAARL